MRCSMARTAYCAASCITDSIFSSSVMPFPPQGSSYQSVTPEPTRKERCSMIFFCWLGSELMVLFSLTDALGTVRVGPAVERPRARPCLKLFLWQPLILHLQSVVK